MLPGADESGVTERDSRGLQKKRRALEKGDEGHGRGGRRPRSRGPRSRIDEELKGDEMVRHAASKPHKEISHQNLVKQSEDGGKKAPMGGWQNREDFQQKGKGTTREYGKNAKRKRLNKESPQCQFHRASKSVGGGPKRGNKKESLRSQKYLERPAKGIRGKGTQGPKELEKHPPLKPRTLRMGGTCQGPK